MMRRLSSLLLVTAALSACGGDPIEGGDPAAQVKASGTPEVHAIVLTDALTTMRNHPDFTIFADLVRQAGLAPRVSGKAPITVFAPTDSAFDKLSPARRAELIDPAQREALAAFVSAHILVGRASARDLGEAINRSGGSTSYQTLAGKPLTLTRSDLNMTEKPSANNEQDAEMVPSAANNVLNVEEQGGGASLVTATDIEATNGVVHALESVLVP